MIATRDGRLVATGRLGAEVDLAAGQDAARACAVNVLARLPAIAGRAKIDAIRSLGAGLHVGGLPRRLGRRAGRCRRIGRHAGMRISAATRAGAASR